MCDSPITSVLTLTATYIKTIIDDLENPTSVSSATSSTEDPVVNTSLAENYASSGEGSLSVYFKAKATTKHSGGGEVTEKFVIKDYFPISNVSSIKGTSKSSNPNSSSSAPALVNFAVSTSVYYDWTKALVDYPDASYGTPTPIA
jgi:hypothetical protein